MSEDGKDHQTFADALSGFRLGESEGLLRLDGPAEFSQATQALLQQVRRKLYILSTDFEPERYNTEEFAEALSAFVRRNRYTQARILIADPAVALRWGHKVLNLSRRLPSHLLIRQLHQDDLPLTEAWILADEIGLLKRDSLQTLKGSLAAKSIPHAQRMARRFDESWERSREITDFRVLDI